VQPAINPLVVSLKESATLAINQRVKALKAAGKRVYHFGFGQSPFPVPERIQEALRQNVDKKDYLPTQGLPELCDAVAKYYRDEFGYDFEGKNVCIGPGSKELIFEAIFLTEGSLLVPAPSWVSYGPQAALRGKHVIPITTSRDNGYKLTAEELDHACYRMGHKQKLLIMNNPCNPTGSVYRDEEMAELAAICRAYQVIVVSDEIYAKIDFDGNGTASLSKHYPEGTIVTGGLSKAFAAGGYRLGVMLIPDGLEPVMRALKSVISETFSAVSAPIQYAALAAYGDYPTIRPFVERTCDIHRFATRYLHKRFEGMGLNCPRPDGAFYLFPDFDNFRESFRARGIITGKDICETILEEAHVAILPGSDFYFPATNLGARVASVDYDGGYVLEKWAGDPASEEETRKLFPNLVDGSDALEKLLKAL